MSESITVQFDPPPAPPIGMDIEVLAARFAHIWNGGDKSWSGMAQKEADRWRAVAEWQLTKKSKP